MISWNERTLKKAEEQLLNLCNDQDLIKRCKEIFEDDVHDPSNRPCATCRQIGEIIDRPFWCYKR